MSMPVLNWLDDRQRVIDGAIKRPPKTIRLRESFADSPSDEFRVYQVFDNVVRRVLARVGASTIRHRSTLLAHASGLTALSDEWDLPTPSGPRVRAKFVFENAARNLSPAVFSHRLGHVLLHGAAEARVDVPIPPAKIGTGGNGTIEVDVATATDPEMIVAPLLPWNAGEYSLWAHVDELLEELTNLDEDLHWAELRSAFKETYGEVMPTDPYAEWEIQTSDETVSAGEGDVRRVSVDVTAYTPGRVLVALKAEDMFGEHEFAMSELAVLEVTPELDIFLLGDLDGDVLPLVDAKGRLAPQGELVSLYS
jgi:hypothetical protein